MLPMIGSKHINRIASTSSPQTNVQLKRTVLGSELISQPLHSNLLSCCVVWHVIASGMRSHGMKTNRWFIVCSAFRCSVFISSIKAVSEILSQWFMLLNRPSARANKMISSLWDLIPAALTRPLCSDTNERDGFIKGTWCSGITGNQSLPPSNNHSSTNSTSGFRVFSTSRKSPVWCHKGPVYFKRGKTKEHILRTEQSFRTETSPWL